MTAQKTKEITSSDDRSAIVRRQFVNAEAWTQIEGMSAKLIQSKALPVTITNAAQLMMVFLAGYEYGMSAMESLNAFYIVDGKITIYGSAVVAQLKRNGFKVKWGACDDNEANVVIIDPDGEEHGEKYTYAEAMKSGLGTKRNWVSYRKNMLRWKAVSNAVRFFCPEVLSGFYLKEEIEAEEDAPKPVIETGTTLALGASDTGKTGESTIKVDTIPSPEPETKKTYEEEAPQLLATINKKIHANWNELAALQGWDAKKAADTRHATIAKHYGGKTSNKELTMAEATDFTDRIRKSVKTRKAEMAAASDKKAEDVPMPADAAAGGVPCPGCGKVYPPDDTGNVSSIKLVGFCEACAAKI